MIGRTFALTLSAMPVAAAAQSAAMPEVPAAIRPHVPQNLRAYFVAFLIAPERPRPMSPGLFLRHQAYIRSQFEAGIYHVAGPLTDNGRVRGILVLSGGSIEDARRIVAADPAVIEGVLAVDLHPAMFPDLSPVRAEYLAPGR